MARWRVPCHYTLSETRRLYLHLYLNRERVGEDEKRLATDLMSLKSDIEKGLWDELSESAQKKAEKYLNTSRLGRGGKLKVAINEEAYAQARKDYGYFALVSNKAEDCFEALRKYRLREKMKKPLKIRKIVWMVHALASGTEIPSKDACSVNLLGLDISASCTRR